eukprot:6468871-Amphidinium_carterae.1
MPNETCCNNDGCLLPSSPQVVRQSHSHITILARQKWHPLPTLSVQRVLSPDAGLKYNKMGLR